MTLQELRAKFPPNVPVSVGELGREISIANVVTVALLNAKSPVVIVRDCQSKELSTWNPENVYKL